MQRPVAGDKLRSRQPSGSEPPLPSRSHPNRIVTNAKDAPAHTDFLKHWCRSADHGATDATNSARRRTARFQWRARSLGMLPAAQRLQRPGLFALIVVVRPVSKRSSARCSTKQAALGSQGLQTARQPAQGRPKQPPCQRRDSGSGISSGGPPVPVAIASERKQDSVPAPGGEADVRPGPRQVAATRSGARATGNGAVASVIAASGAGTPT